MGILQSAERQIGGFFKGMPPLPKQSKEALAKAWPLIALIFGVLQLFVAYGLWQATRVVERLNDIANSFSVYVTGQEVGLSSTEKMVMYLGVITLAVDAVILLMAYPHLKTRSRRGWDLLFLGSLINTLYAVLTLFMGRNGGIGNFIFTLLGSAVGFYLLFQVKEYYGRTAHSSE